MRKVASVFALLILLSMIPVSALYAGDWPMFLKDTAHSSQVDQAPAPPYDVKWRFEAKGAFYSSPVVYKNRVFAGSYDKNMYALDAQTGAVLWTFESDGVILGAPAAVNDMLYFGTKGGKVYALSVESGKPVWTVDAEAGVMTSMLVVDDVVYFGAQDLYFYALNARTGKRIWRLPVPDMGIYSGIYSSPVYYEGSLFIVGKNGIIYSVDAKSMARNWVYRLGAAVYASPIVKGGVVYISTYGKKILALGVKNGKVVWRNDLEDEFAYASPVFVKGRIYQGLKNGQIKIFDAANGGDKGAITLQGSVDATPVITSSGMFLVGTGDGIFYALDAETGGVKWKFETDGAIHASAAVTENAVYVSTLQGSLYAFGTQKK